MFDSPVIDTVVGLVFVFYATALVCSGAVEAIANLLKKRSKYLLRGIRDLLQGQRQVDPALQWWWKNTPVADRKAEMDLYRKALGTVQSQALGPVETLMSHPLVLPYRHITSSGAARRNPSYLPSSVFAKSLLDMLPLPPNTPLSPQSVLQSLPPGSHLQRALGSLAKIAGNDMDRFTKSLEDWFDGEMERVSGSYKRWAKRWAIAVAVIVVVVFQVDTIAIGKALYTDQTVRSAVVQAASSDKLCPPSASASPRPEPSPSGTGSNCIPDKLDDLGLAGLPVGWSGNVPHGVAGWLLKIVGLALTAGAAALGAPFWFNALNKISSLRNTGTKPDAAASNR